MALVAAAPAADKAKRSTAPKKDQGSHMRGRMKDIGAFEHNTGR